jgi:precorrin-3B C17-methyltransferase
MTMHKKLFIIGIGPGDKSLMSWKALDCLKKSQVIIGYKNYIDLLDKKLISNKIIISTGMKKEIERCKAAIDQANTGKIVSLISSGDPGIYGMAGLALEIIDAAKDYFDVEIIPGITSASSCASILGAPLSNDFAVISLSDILTKWSLIKKRIKFASLADFVIALYNPKSKSRIKQIEDVHRILLRYKNKNTPVGIVENAHRKNEKSTITTLDDMLNYKIDMNTTIIIGNSKTYIKNNKMITSRGYEL